MLRSSLVPLLLCCWLSAAGAWHHAAPSVAVQRHAVRRRAALTCQENNNGDEEDKDAQPKGPGAILAGLPWWFPIAIGWALAPQFGVQPPALPDNIFAAPTARQERQILKDEASMFSQEVVQDLYGNAR